MNNNFRTIVTFIFFAVGILIIGIVLILIVKEHERANIIQDEIYTLEQEKKEYEHNNKELQDKVTYLQSEHSYEKEAKKLNYKKQGEHVVIVRRATDVKKKFTEFKTEEKQEKKEHYQVWFEYFF